MKFTGVLRDTVFCPVYCIRVPSILFLQQYVIIYCFWSILKDFPIFLVNLGNFGINLLENPSNKEKIWSETSKTVCWDILLQEQYGRCSSTVYWAKNSIAHHP